MLVVQCDQKSLEQNDVEDFKKIRKIVMPLSLWNLENIFRYCKKKIMELHVLKVKIYPDEETI